MVSSLPEASILVIDDDAEVRYSLQRVLSARDYQVSCAANGNEGIEMAEKEMPTVIFLDNRMDGMSGLETLQHLRNLNPHVMVILMTAYSTTQTAIEAMKFGAFDYIVKPFDTKRILSLTENAIKAQQDLVKAGAEYTPLLNIDDYKEGLVGSSQEMQEVFKVIGQVAVSDVTVMITGKSGTGKELIARCICQHSLRANGPFTAVNCAAIPDNLVESELFGHEKGAFTGATQQRMGKFELCDKGTIFLDEIGDMSLTTQTKILRVLQDGELQRVGGNETIKVDVRLIAATNKDIEKMVSENEFREDLYYRLNVVRLKLPPLKDRKGDIPQLVDFILQELAQGGKVGIKQIASEAMSVLMKYDWPGNVRELENIIHRSAVIAQGDVILAKNLPQEIFDNVKSSDAVEQEPEETADSEVMESELIGSVSAENSETAPGANPGDIMDRLYQNIRGKTDKDILQEIEREMIQRALKETGGNQVKTAAILGITRSTLRKRIEQFSLKY
jgi:two-component system nitrogen regulation response regulator GlnG